RWGVNISGVSSVACWVCDCVCVCRGVCARTLVCICVCMCTCACVCLCVCVFVCLLCVQWFSSASITLRATGELLREISLCGSCPLLCLIKSAHEPICVAPLKWSSLMQGLLFTE